MTEHHEETFTTNLYIPPNYKSELPIRNTQIAVNNIKQKFSNSFSQKLCLTLVQAPLFVSANSGMNDTLNGVEAPVSFHTNEFGDESMQIVQSLAKWKRIALKEYGFSEGEGLYTNMYALRPSETTDNLHSVLVDQWDWEQVIAPQDRTLEKLEDTVNKIYEAIKEIEDYTPHQILPPKVTFISSQELKALYPNHSSKDREYLFSKEKGAIFIEQIGGDNHENRAPDYDDWELNGDLIFYYPLLDTALEISSMGIRVDKDSLLKQLKFSGRESYATQDYHRQLLEGELPYTIGGGIGQSRLCMFLLNKAHIGEVQSSVWPKLVQKEAFSKNLFFL